MHALLSSPAALFDVQAAWSGGPQAASSAPAQDASEYQKRVALVIGNSRYVNAPLPNAVNDAISGMCSTQNLIDLTSNDSDPDGDSPLTVSAISRTSGSASVSSATGGIVGVTFGPLFDASTFTYTLRDPSGATDTATLSVTTTSCPGGGLPPF